MTIHAHILTWNEEKILPFTLSHYLQFCEKIFIWDNESTDGTMRLIAEYNGKRNIIVHRFGTNNFFDDATNAYIKNHCWKHSASEADYVIVCDCDEHVYHPDIRQYLKEHKDDTFHQPEWYEMVSEEFPDEGGLLSDKVKHGVYNPHGKMLMFKPDITAVNYSVGAHEFKPVAEDVSISRDNELKTLHYKFLSADYVITRYLETSARFSPINLKAGFGVHQTIPAAKIREKHQILLNQSIRVIK